MGKKNKRWRISSGSPKKVAKQSKMDLWIETVSGGTNIFSQNKFAILENESEGSRVNYPPQASAEHGPFEAELTHLKGPVTAKTSESKQKNQGSLEFNNNNRDHLLTMHNIW